MTRRRLAPLLILVLLGACTADKPKDSAGGAPARSSPSARPSPPPTLSDYRAMRKSWPLRRAKSTPAQVGVAYRFRLPTHCGVDWYVDFDGSFWRALHQAESIDNGDYGWIDGFSERGTMTLVSENGARFASNEGPVIDFARGPSRKRMSDCF